ncbi:MAG: hypothetical protein AABW82_02765 [Nanoarchaeota archaeon]
MKKGMILLSFLFIFLGFISLVPAEVSITQPESTYNKGDEFGLNVSLVRSDSINGFLEVNIECDSGVVSLYRSPIALKSGQRKNVEISTFLEEIVIGKVLGKCNVKGSYSDELVKSRDFTISTDVDVSATFLKNSYNPGENLIFDGLAVKKNGKNLNGFLEVSLPGTSFTNLINVNEGKFSSSISLPTDLPAGEQSLVLHAYEKDLNGDIINEGTFNSNVKIAQVAKEAKIALNKESILPGEELIYTVLVYDQTNQDMKAVGEVVIVSSDGKILSSKSVSSGDASTLLIASNSTPGLWSVKGKVGEIITKKDFNIENLEKVSFEMMNSSLTVRNIGNVFYNKSIEIKIGDVSELKQINLMVGESKRYRLAAPDGNYEVKISEGIETESLGSVFLTGKTVSVQEEAKMKFLTSTVTWVWVIILILFGLAVAFYYKKIAKSDFVGKKPDYPLLNASNIDSVNRKDIDNGRKEKVNVVSLKIKGLAEFMNEDSSAGEIIKRVLQETRELKAKVVQSGENFNMIFAPIMTKDTDNSLRSVNIANLIKREFDAHNKKYAQKIEYGLGIHEGDMIVELNKGDLKFNPLSNAISYAKKMADSLDGEVYLSNQLHSATRAKVKVEKSKDGLYWKVNSIPDGDKHTKFIRKFMERQSRD